MFQDERLETKNRQPGVGSRTRVEPLLNSFVSMLLQSLVCTSDSADYIHINSPSFAGSRKSQLVHYKSKLCRPVHVIVHIAL
jgi:hypothetical protein